MNLELTEAQAAVDELFGSLFAKECSPAVVRTAEKLGFAPDLWRLVRTTGAATICLGQAAGGGGGGLFEAALVAEAAGRHLAPVPLAEHLVASRLLERTAAVQPLAEAVEALVPLSIALHRADSIARVGPCGGSGTRLYRTGSGSSAGRA